MSLKSKVKSLAGACLVFLLLVPGLPAAENDLRLVEAAKDRDMEAVRFLLRQHADVNAAQPDGTTALAWAVLRDNLEMADLLIRAGANVNAANDIGVTPLSLAINNRNAALVEKLLEAKADPNALLWSGETPLMTAASAGNIDVVKSLLAHGANINAKEPRRGQTALMWAIADGHPEVARLLIDNGADVRAKSYKFGGFRSMVFATYGGDIPVTSSGGYTPLLFAVKAGDLDTTRLLLEKGADVNEGTPEEGSALLMAVAAGHEKLALFLLEKGADPNATSAGDGMTALHYAMSDGLKVLNGISIARVRRICGSGSGGRCIALDNPESVAFLDGGDLPIVKLLREQGILPAKSDAVGPDSASGAPTSDKADKVAELFAKLPDIGYGDRSAGTFSGSNMPELAKALLAHGADPNVPLMESPPQLRMRRKPIISLKGVTPFMLAAAAHDVDSMRILAEGGARLVVETVSDPKEINNKDHGQDNQIQGNGTPLLVAAGLGRKDDMGKEEQRRSLEAVTTLVEMGAEVDQASDTGWTPLHTAAFVGADAVVEYLVSKGANLNARNGCGQTPLSLAAGASARGLLQRAIPHPSTAELLRKLGAVKNPPNNPVGACVLGRFGLDYASVKEEGK